MCELVFEPLRTKFGGRYYSLTPGHPNEVSEATYSKLVAKHLLFKDMSNDPYLTSAGIASDWPVGRGAFVSGDEKFIVWVGEEDHLRIIYMKRGFVLNEVFEQLKRALDDIEAIEGLKFARSEEYG